MNLREEFGDLQGLSMKVVVFGASGATGRELVKQGAEQAHTITAFVRNSASFDIKHSNLQLVEGNVGTRSSVEEAVVGRDAVICALGSRTLIRRDPAIVVGVHNIITTMELAGVARLIYLSADSVRASRKNLNPVRTAFLSVILHNPTADHELNETMIRESHLDWIIVRPPKLTNGQHTGTYRSGEHLNSEAFIPRISRADLADFMLKQLTDDRFLRRTLELMY